MPGTFKPVGDYEEAVALGAIQNTNSNPITEPTLLGRNDNVGTGAPQAFRPEGGNFYFPTTSDFVRIAAGGNVADDVTGSGARTVIIFGILADLTEGIEILTTAGTSASASSLQSFMRVNLAIVQTVGTSRGFNAGTITIEHAGGGGAFITIQAEEARSELGCYSSPADTMMSIRALVLTVEEARPVSFNLLFLGGFDITSEPFPPVVTLSEIRNVSPGIHEVAFRNPLIVPGPADFYATASTENATSAATVAAAIRLIPSK